jgi:hypothetical protein
MKNSLDFFWGSRFVGNSLDLDALARVTKEK